MWPRSGERHSHGASSIKEANEANALEANAEEVNASEASIRETGAREAEAIVNGIFSLLTAVSNASQPAAGSLETADDSLGSAGSQKQENERTGGI